MKTSIANKTHQEIPPAIVAALKRAKFEFTNLVSIFHCIEVYPNSWVGVVGDGENGAYESFAFNDGKLTHSNCGYGQSSVALRNVLLEEVAA